jgi:hypothetical protein
MQEGDAILSKFKFTMTKRTSNATLYVHFFSCYILKSEGCDVIHLFYCLLLQRLIVITLHTKRLRK